MLPLHATPSTGLQSLTLRPEYRSDENDLIRELYEPCLVRSQLYLRAVGYFTSHGISAAAKGIEAFVRGTGKMRLVASPSIDPEDQEAIRRGYLAREDATERAVLKAMAEIDDAAVRDRLGYLAWQAADGREVHRLGSPANRAALAGLSDAIRYRLGLSATWEREYDADGTAFIIDHVGPVVFTFGLDDAR